jgi:hypothetical protein
MILWYGVEVDAWVATALGIHNWGGGVLLLSLSLALLVSLLVDTAATTFANAAAAAAGCCHAKAGG